MYREEENQEHPHKLRLWAYSSYQDDFVSEALNGVFIPEYVLSLFESM